MRLSPETSSEKLETRPETSPDSETPYSACGLVDVAQSLETLAHSWIDNRILGNQGVTVGR